MNNNNNQNNNNNNYNNKSSIEYYRKYKNYSLTECNAFLRDLIINYNKLLYIQSNISAIPKQLSDSIIMLKYEIDLLKIIIRLKQR